MTILGVDYGRKRIGLATGDPATGFVFPLRSIERKKGDDAATLVIEAAREASAGHVVVGVPRRLDGSTAVPGDIEKEALALVDAIRARSDLTVDVEDERMSTALAKRLCESAERKAATDKDAVAACVILESYILRTFSRDEPDIKSD